MQTRVTELLGIEKPIVQGAMAWVANASLASAVSEAGGLGIIASGAAPLSWIEEQVVEARSLTKKPIGVNVMLMNPEAAQIAALLAELKVEVITTGAGSPVAYIEQWKEAGSKVIPVVASSALAVRMEKCGADAIVAEGCEAGGHIGELTTMTLIPQVCDKVSIPVIAAGGIADGRGVCAAFALGAEAVQVGTRFLTVNECTIAQAYKDKVISAKDSDTIVTGRKGGHPVRALKNAFSRQVRMLEEDPATNPDVLEELYAGSLRRAVQGDITEGSLMAGQAACLVHEAKSAKEAIDDMFSEAESWGAMSLQEMADATSQRRFQSKGDR